LRNGVPLDVAGSLQQFSVELVEPRYVNLSAYPLAWSASTNGPVSGEPIMAPLRVSFRDGPVKLKEQIEAYKAKWSGKLRGKIVMLTASRIPRPQASPQFRRYTAAELADLSIAPDPAVRKNIKKARGNGVGRRTPRTWGNSFRACPTR